MAVGQLSAAAGLKNEHQLTISTADPEGRKIHLQRRGSGHKR